MSSLLKMLKGSYWYFQLIYKLYFTLHLMILYVCVFSFHKAHLQKINAKIMFIVLRGSTKFYLSESSLLLKGGETTNM